MRDGRPRPSSPVRIGLVVPSYGYANFLPEMARGILAQRCEARFLAVLVDDCDPDPEIVALCRTYAAAHPERLHYIRPRRNGGLSATRNLGVSYLLDLCPELDMVMFPDADDRMLPGFLEKSHAAFLRARERSEADGLKLGWVFEDPNIFGHAGFMHRVTRHSTLWNQVGATQMPSSALSAELFRAGLRYDETMTWGGEDWEFSLRALDAGFVGVHAPDLGFLWRRRPGSMSSAAMQARAREHNRALIRLRNPEMFARPAVWARMARENTAFAVLERDGWQPARTPDALRKRLRGERGAETDLCGWTLLARQLNGSLTRPADPCSQSFYATPGGMAPEAAGGALAAIDLRGALQWIEVLLARGRAVTLSLSPAPGAPALAPYVPGEAEDLLHAVARPHLLAMLRRPGAEPDRHLRLTWPAPGAASEPAPPASDPVPAPPEGTALSAAFAPALEALAASGYAFHRPGRFGAQAWRPQNLDWRGLPGFLVGLPGQVLHDAEMLSRSLVLCHARYAADLSRRVDALGLAEVDVMIDGTEAERDFHAEGLARLRATPGVAGWHVWREGTEAGANLGDVSRNILGLYGTLVHWRSTAQARRLADLRKLGLRNVLALSQADLQARALNFSSMFKGYDSYMLIDGPAGDGASALAARGVARRRQAQRAASTASPVAASAGATPEAATSPRDLQGTQEKNAVR